LIVKEFLDHAASECLDKRESYLVIFTTGMHGYVCRNEGATDPSRALFHGTYRECQIWIERRGIAAALDYVRAHLDAVAELAHPQLAAQRLMEIIAQVDG